MHLSNTYAQNGTQDNSFDSSRRTYLIQKQIEDIMVLLSFIGLNTEMTTLIDQGYETTLHVQKSMLIVSQLRGAKTIITKIINSLQDHESHSLSLTDESQLIVKRCEQAIEELFKILQTIEPPQISENDKHTSFRHYDNNHVSKTPEPIPNFKNSILLDYIMSEVQSLKNNLAQLAQFSQGFANTIEISRSPAPWVLRAKSINELKSVSVAAKKDLNKLRNAISNAASELLNRETALEESKVKIELLETRARDSSLKSARIDELQKTLEQYRMRADELAKAVQNYKTDVATLAAERDQLHYDFELNKHDGQLNNNSKDDGYYDVLLIARLREIFPLRIENNYLRTALKCLREKSRICRKSAFFSTRCSIMNQNDHLRQISPSVVDHRRGNDSWSDVPASWLAAPLASRQNYTPYNLSACKVAKLFVSDHAILPRPIMLSKLSDRSKRLKWQPLRCTAQWQLSFEEQKMSLWFQRWVNVNSL